MSEQQPSTPDFEDEMPSAITHLPPPTQKWAHGLHVAVRDLRKEISRAKWLLIVVIPLEVAAVLGAIELYGKVTGK